MRRGAITVLAAAAALLAGCSEDKPAADPGAPEQTPSSASMAPPAEPVQEETVVELSVEGGKRASGVAQIEVEQGEQVVFVVTSDAADELHLHGYDKTADLQPGEPARLAVTADLPGVWELELHHSGVLLTELKVTG